jgi:hypothetical protein
VIAIVAGAIVIVVPVPHPYSGQATTTNDGSGQYYGGSHQSFHADSKVTVDWKSSGGQTVYFTVVVLADRSILACATVTGSSGSCTFPANEVVYDYFVSDYPLGSSTEGVVTVSFAGTYSNPLIEG